MGEKTLPNFEKGKVSTKEEKYTYFIYIIVNIKHAGCQV